MRSTTPASQAPCMHQCASTWSVNFRISYDLFYCTSCVVPIARSLDSMIEPESTPSSLLGIQLAYKDSHFFAVFYKPKPVSKSKRQGTTDILQFTNHNFPSTLFPLTVCLPGSGIPLFRWWDFPEYYGSAHCPWIHSFPVRWSVNQRSCNEPPTDCPSYKVDPLH